VFESEADRLALIKAVGGEKFSTGYTEDLWGIFDHEFSESPTGQLIVETRKPMITCRTSDVALHGLIKDSAIERIKDGAKYFARRFEPDGTGMTMIAFTS
jgi:hypothetical protein